jgi:hypothetical protein
MVLLRKSMPMVAWYVLSKVSYMNLFRESPGIVVHKYRVQGYIRQTLAMLVKRNSADRVIRLVLPTLWSPRSTIFVLFGGADEKSAAGEVSDMVVNKCTWRV